MTTQNEKNMPTKLRNVENWIKFLAGLSDDTSTEVNVGLLKMLIRCYSSRNADLAGTQPNSPGTIHAGLASTLPSPSLRDEPDDDQERGMGFPEYMDVSDIEITPYEDMTKEELIEYYKAHDEYHQEHHETEEKLRADLAESQLSGKVGLSDDQNEALAKVKVWQVNLGSAAQYHLERGDEKSYRACEETNRIYEIILAALSTPPARVEPIEGLDEAIEELENFENDDMAVIKNIVLHDHPKCTCNASICECCMMHNTFDALKRYLPKIIKAARAYQSLPAVALSGDDFKAFKHTLDNPPEPTKELAELMCDTAVEGVDVEKAAKVFRQNRKYRLGFETEEEADIRAMTEALKETGVIRSKT